jgi:GAF domain-containing protein
MHPSSTRTEYEKRQLAFYRYIQGLQKQDTAEGMGKIVFHFLKEWFQFELIWIAQYEAQSHLLSGIQGILPKTTDRDAIFLRRKQTILPGDLFDQVLLTGTLQEIPSLKQEQRVGEWQAIAQSQNIQGCLILPIRYRQESFGVILVGTTLWGGHPRSEEMTELKLLATTLGAELYRILGQANSLPTQSPQQLSMDTLGQILAAETFEERLGLVLEQLHRAIRSTRSCLYWFDVEAQSCRLYDIYTGPSPRRSGSKVIPKLDLSLQSITSFYQGSLQNQTVAIADMQGLITSSQAPTRLMTMTRSRAWLSTPIFDRGRLIAVLAAENDDPRLWSDPDRQSIQLLAKLLGQGSQERARDSSLAKSGDHLGLNGLLSLLNDVYNDNEQWDHTLLQCLEQIGIQFSIRWAAILTQDSESRDSESRDSETQDSESRDSESRDFRCSAQFYSKKKHQPLADRLPQLSGVDAKMLARMSSPIAVQSLSEDLKLLAWRQPLADRGVQSLLLLKLGQNVKGSNLGKFLLLATDLPRTWTPEEIGTATDVAEPLGQALSQREQWQYEAFQMQFMTVLNQSLQAIQLTPPGDALFSTAAQSLHTLLEVECLMILRWSPDRPEAKIAALINDSKFQVNSQIPISWQTDGFLQRILSPATEPDSPAAFPQLVIEQGSIEDLAAENSGWLSGMGRVDLLAVPLRICPEDPCLGLVLILDSRCQYWTDLTRGGIQLLTRELTVSYRSQYLVERLRKKQTTLECLNWYKQRHLEYISQLWTAQLPKFQAALPSPELAAASGQGGSRSRNNPVGDLYSALSSLDNILKSEVWDLQLEPEHIQVATLFRRSLERIEELARTRQIWTQVHNLTPSVSLYVPAQKLELMLVELLLAACYRSKVGDRIDIWCRTLPDQWVEISITDNGRLNPRMVRAIQNPSIQVPLSAPMLEAPPGLHYKVCQSLVERMGGQLEMAQLEDGRAMSRLILPIVPAPAA